jgi:hypothetical protein
MSPFDAVAFGPKKRTRKEGPGKRDQERGTGKEGPGKRDRERGTGKEGPGKRGRGRDLAVRHDLER